MIYIVCFIFSVYMMYIGERKMERTRGAFNWNILIAAFFPIILAGLRDVNIGIDTTWYVTPSYHAALSNKNLSSFLRYMSQDDLGFFIYSYIITKIFYNLAVLMTFNHAIIILPLVYALYYFKKEYSFSMWFGYAIWLLNDYNMSLCLIRQSMSISIAVLAFVFFMKRKWLYVVLLSFLAYNFHHTTVVFLLVFILFYYLSTKVKKLSGQVLIAVGIIITIYIAQYIIGYALPFLDAKYSERLDYSESMAGGVFTAITLFILSTYPFWQSILKKRIIFDQSIMYLPLVGFVLYIVSRNFGYLSRMAYPFNLMVMFTLPIAVKPKWVKMGILVVLLTFWIVAICMRGDWETYPYLFTPDITQ